MAAFDTFVLKVANRCNIDCDYCYVFNRVDQRARRLPARMGLPVASAAADRIAEYAIRNRLHRVHVVLHGGEPLLAGVAHLDALLSTVLVRVGAVSDVHLQLQTNATLVHPGWLDLFERLQVAVGVSLDGPPQANDLHRLTRAGRSTAAAAERGIALLRSRPGLLAGVLAVVDLGNDPVEVYRHLAGLAPPMIDFNLPHATYDEPPPRAGHPDDAYGRWLAGVYDAWLADSGQVPQIRVLEDIVALSCGARGSVESLGLAPSGVVVIESDGGIESTDALRATAKGASQVGMNVFTHGLDDAVAHPEVRLRRGGRDTLAGTCLRCDLVEVCGGGHIAHRYRAADGFRNPSVYCADLDYVIRHVQQSIARHPDTGLILRTTHRHTMAAGDPGAGRGRVP
ncbi:FxsB family cyclophane-forming radical SAM/SPASM peptide maturase [Solwaraspora sp. WMMB335]|uniref:FxsB family cyclophane-forming radical SAM/SPASM peptide maturase n=1 Tax=Solwaraspora sp. WMMB335 TaxID=3404118 RepID=UPI003B9345D7